MSRSAITSRLYPALFAVALALLLAGCGSADDPATSVGDTDPGPGAESPDYSRGENDLILRIEQEGGFLPVELVFTMVPGFSLYGDGRVIYSGPIPEIFPGPALPNLLQMQLSEEGVGQLLEAALEAGLTQDEPDLGQPPVADASTTVFTLTVNGRTHIIRAYALGYEPDLSPEGTAPGEAPGAASPEEQGMPVFELTEEQREARRRLLDFQSRLVDLRSWLGDEAGPEETYEYEALDVIAQRADPEAQDPSGVEPNVQPWPLDDLAGLGEAESRGRRFRLAGADLEALAPQLAQANMLTLWQSGDALYTLYFRPLLPDETAGPAAPAE